MLKRILSCVLAVVLTLSALPMTAIAETVSRRYGDVNQDGSIDLKDVLILKRCLAEQEVPEFHFANADVNVDERVDMSDLLILKKYLAEWDVQMGPELVTVSFYDGDRLIEAMPTPKGTAPGAVPNVAKSSKANAILEGYYLDPAFTLPFYAEVPVKESIRVYAKYAEMGGTEELNFTSFARMDQSPDVSFEIVRVSGTVPAEEAAILLVMDGSDPVSVSITDKDGDGTYSVCAPEGFLQGASYQLELAEGWIFKDKEDTIRTASFSIAMEEVENLQMNDGILYIQDTDAISYTVGGKTYQVLTGNVLTEDGGSFSYAAAGNLKKDDIVCVYVGVNPTQRDADNGSELLDPAVYVKVTGVSGTTVSFRPLDAQEQSELYNVPDNFPIQVSALPQGQTGTVNIALLDKELYATMMGDQGTVEKALEKINVGDFLTLYINTDGIQSKDDLYFAQITAYDARTGEITYRQVEEKTILESMDLYQPLNITGDDLLTDEEKQAMEATLQQQLESSNFAMEAVNVLADMVTKTDGFRNNLTVRDYLLTDENGEPLAEDDIRLQNLGKGFELSDDVKLTVELITRGDQLHFDKGIQMAIKVDATFEIDVEDGGKVAIDLSATFVEEVQIDPSVRGKIVTKKILFIPVPTGVSVNACVDIRNFTAFSFAAEIYTVAEKDKSLWEKVKAIAKDPTEVLGLPGMPERFKDGLKSVGDVMDKIEEIKGKIDKATDTLEKIEGYKQDLMDLWTFVESNDITTQEAWEQMGQQLGKTSVAADLLDMMDMTTDTEISAEYLADMQALMDKYCETIQKETDWVKLVEENICFTEANISGIAIGVSVDFIVRADMSIAIGSNLEYEVGKRYNFWFKIGLFKPSAGSSSMDLLDEHFAFQFYVMGRVGLKAGVHAKFYVGIGSGKFASVGITTELGPYIKLYGFFVYEYTQYRPANTQDWTSKERMAGALYLDFGLYFMLGFEANALGDLFEYSYDFLDMEVPLLTAGNSRYYYGTAYAPAEDELVILRDEDGDSSNGITMVPPDSVLALSYVDLDTGVQGIQRLDYNKYIFSLSNPNFTIDNQTGIMEVTVPENTRYMEGDLTVTYRYGKLAFSQFDMSVTVPLVWTNLSTAELSEYYTASLRVGNAQDGYQTIWQKRVLKNQPFDLPSEDEVRKLMGWNDAKYAASTGYGDQTLTGLTLIQDTVYDYEVDLREYKVTVNGIQNADGTKTSGTYYAYYGEAFDFSDLAATGTSLASEGKFTKFTGVTTTATIMVNGQAQTIDLTQRINGKIAAALESGVTATAEYVDDSASVTFSFTGLVHEDVAWKIRKGTAPDIAVIEEIVSYNGLAIKDITPELGTVNGATVYQVVCGELVGPDSTLTLHVNGGSPLPDITKVEGSLVGTLPTPTRTGYTFGGWFTDDGTFENEFSQRKMPSGGADLYAKWTANEYTLTFHVNGGNNLEETEQTKTVTFDSAIGALPAATRTGYGFVGWFTEKDGGIQVSTDTKVTTASNQTLYAHWKELVEIPAAVFDFGEAESGTYAKGQTHEVLYNFAAVEGGTYQLGDFTFKYMRQGNSEYEEGLPVNAGTYNVTVSRPADNDYAKFEQTYTAVITIDKAVRTLGAVEIEAADSGYTWVDLRLVGNGGIDDLSDQATFTYTAVKTDGTLIFPDYTSTSADHDGLVTGLFPATQYIVIVKVTGDPNYMDAESTLEGASVVTTLSAPTGNWADHADTSWYDSSLSEFTLTLASELAGLAKLVNNNTNFSGKTVKLGADIDLLAYQWTPIGNSSYSFQGTFDGQNHTVKGMYADCAYSGLFGNIYSATVKNLTLQDSYTTTNQTDTGGIVAYARYRSRIENCVVGKDVTVYSTVQDNNYNAGGVVGNCYDEVVVTGCVNWGVVYGVYHVGGIVGYSNDALILTNCVNYGPIRGNSFIGGIVGYTYDEGNVLNSANFGSVTGEDCVGGIVGKTRRKNDGGKYPNNVLNCYNVGTVYGKTYVGAIVGGRQTTDDAVHQCYYVPGCATNQYGAVKAVGISGTGSTDSEKNLQIACFTSYDSIMTGSSAGDCGLTNLITALNNWVKLWNDKQCNAKWEEGPDGYPLPIGKINTNKGTKQ